MNTSLLADMIRSQLEHVRVETTVLPTLEIDHPFADGAPSEAGAYFKPKVTLTIAGQDFVIAPYGEPGPTAWPAIKTATVAVLGILTVGAIKSAMRRRS